MNEHLKPIFEILLPNLENADTNYWVFGGVALAGMKGKFYRPCRDVDIFVFDRESERTISSVKAISEKNLWLFKPAKKVRGRPKWDLLIDNKERFSVMPIYERGSEIEFIFENGPKRFPRELLESVTYRVGIYRFTAPGEDLLKRLLRCYLECFFKSERRMRSKSLWEKRKLDAEQILGYEEAKKLFSQKL